MRRNKINWKNKTDRVTSEDLRLQARLSKVHPDFDPRPAFRQSAYTVSDPGDAAKGVPPRFVEKSRVKIIAAGKVIAASDREYVVDGNGAIRRRTPKPKITKKQRRASRKGA